jgi:omega-6 fatty acid desaturase (delta-12 desaturase)
MQAARITVSGLRPGASRVGAAKPLARVATLPHAAAAPLPPSGIQLLDDEERQRVAEEYGFRKIGVPLPDDVTLGQVQRSLPAEVFELNEFKAWKGVVTSLVSMAASLYLISVTPWYLLPVSWFIAGTAFTGFFVVGHDCGHRTFSKNKLLEDIVGTIMFAPLVYPFEPWRIKHNQHHAFTNKLVDDTAWHPVMPAELEKWGPVTGALYKFFLGTPLKFFASVGHQLIWHFNLDLYSEQQKPRVIVSLAAVFAFMAVVFPLLISKVGIAGWAKYWLMPWLGYHFWMSAFTVIHHTAPHIPFKAGDDWNPAQAQLGGTVHCDFPRWVEFLCHDISVHVPHHVSTKVPWYNLRKANESLRENWGQYMTEATFNKKLVKTISAELHVFDKERNYVPFDAVNKGDSWWCGLQRAILA